MTYITVFLRSGYVYILKTDNDIHLHEYKELCYSMKMKIVGDNREILKTI